jgi:hypothetical protein
VQGNGEEYVIFDNNNIKLKIKDFSFTWDYARCEVEILLL